MIVFLLLSSSFEPLPREGTTEEVHNHVGKGFKVVTGGLLNTQVGVDGCILRHSMFSLYGCEDGSSSP